ncbi:AAA family ATPase [Alteromonas stellipolaris]|uniref:AAA family ATPase n=1 Tax=Alteromonas stellipolaris TaxID=233316 RepID=UPI0026E1BC3E|nr:AAA family ATPase [Alteromonas stellipolaris]MDO6534827.1 AAA family ATPase [Alteromonas stellipolaris]MDO6626704.1 AAA family ATPase [Alteromonas stellipolaris]
MTLTFRKIGYRSAVPQSGREIVYLTANNWDDYNYKTQFNVTIFDAQANRYELGDVKVGYRGQQAGWTIEAIPDGEFQALPEGFFSLGQDVDYYKAICSELPHQLRGNYLAAIKDVVASNEIFSQATNESVFNISLTRSVNADAVFGQFQRVLNDEAVLTPFYFRYFMPRTDIYSGIDIDFDIVPNSKPPTNVHVLIGRNGIGKTILLNNIVKSLVTKDYHNSGAFFSRTSEFGNIEQIDPDNFFSRIISVSFSAFDRFIPPDDQDNHELGVRYTYIGLKKVVNPENDGRHTVHKSSAELCNDFIYSIVNCFRSSARRKRWEVAIKKLESDRNFEDMNLVENLSLDPQDKQEKIELERRCRHLFETKLSSGHAIVLLTITRLVEKVDEKSLVILDEPESHLHPPLLSAFTSSLSYLLLNRNGVALIATHSPVILQEVPRGCVWKIRRIRLELRAERPELETFGENVGVLTREVFGLEVFQSGFYADLARLVEEGKSFEKILEEYNYQIGFEGKALLNSLIANRGN